MDDGDAPVDSVAVADVVGKGVCTAETDCVTAAVPLADAPSDRVAVTEGVGTVDGELDGDAPNESVAVDDVVGKADGSTVCVGVGGDDGDTDAPVDSDAVAEGGAVGVMETVEVDEGGAPTDSVAVIVGVVDVVGKGVDCADGDTVMAAVSDGVALSDTLALFDAV